MTGLLWQIFAGLTIAAFFKDMVIHPYFRNWDVLEDGRREKRVYDAKKLPQMTKERAICLLGLNKRKEL